MRLPSPTTAFRTLRARLLADADHYEELIRGAITNARTSVWIATANVKEMRVEAPIGTRARARGRFQSILDTFDGLASRGVELRLLHSGVPSRAFAAELERHPRLAGQKADARPRARPPRTAGRPDTLETTRGKNTGSLSARSAGSLATNAANAQGKAPLGLAIRQCPRVHLKLIAVDGALLYLGSANFTGAGLGAKGTGRRNFEMGIVTDDDVLLDLAQQRFERVWTGAECGGCRLRAKCPAPLDGKSR